MSDSDTEMDEEGRNLAIPMKNPLLLYHIVQLVISYVDVKSLPLCRQVCRQWERLALPKLLQNVHKFPVVITGQEEMARYLTYRAENPRIIYSNFTLKGMLFSGPLWDKFTSTYAAEITDLTLEFSSEYRTPPDLQKLMEYLVNLQTLTFNTGPDMTYSHTTTETPRTSNLKRLCLINKGSYVTAACSNLLVVMNSCRSLEELSLDFGDRIQYLHSHLGRNFLSSAVASCPNALVEISVNYLDDLDLLIRLENLKLKALKCQLLVLWSWGDEVSRLSDVLEKYKNTLESVVVGEIISGNFRNSKTMACEIKFPDVMPKLKVFALYHAARKIGRIYFSPVKFPIQLPSLEKLSLNDGRQRHSDPDLRDGEFLAEMFEGSEPHLKLKELCLPYVSSKLRKSIGAVFPEITVLKMETRLDESPHEIFKIWPQLKSLDLTLNGNLEKMENFITEDKDGDSSLPSIANLRGLKQFKLRKIGHGGSLSDFSVSRVFCNFPYLEFILLSHHNVSEEETEELLKNHPLLKKVACSDHPNVYKIQRKDLPNNFIPSEFSTDSFSRCDCSFPIWM